MPCRSIENNNLIVTYFFHKLFQRVNFIEINLSCRYMPKPDEELAYLHLLVRQTVHHIATEHRFALSTLLQSFLKWQVLLTLCFATLIGRRPGTIQGPKRKTSASWTRPLHRLFVTCSQQFCVYLRSARQEKACLPPSSMT